MKWWGRLMRWLGLTRIGRYTFTILAFAGLGLTIADDVIPRSGSEADLGPNVAAVVLLYTLFLLGLVAFIDFVLRSAARAIRDRLSNPTS